MKYTDNIYNISQNIGKPSSLNALAHGENESLVENIGHSKAFKDLVAIPNWNISDFIDMRLKFQTQQIYGSDVNIFSEQGTFFYKLYFNFNTGYGLFGDCIQTSSGEYVKNENTAVGYLNNNINSPRFSEAYKNTLSKKKEYLISFAKLLNYISNECPWFIKTVSGLKAASSYNFANVSEKENKKITVSFNQDAIDMRVSTLFNLYLNACYDIANYREVIPENLRFFDMTILLFNPPIVGQNISDIPTKDSTNLSIDYNNIKTAGVTYDNSSADNRYNNITFSALIFKNCEFDIKSISSIDDSLDNSIGNKQERSVDITFERVYPYTVNNELGLKIF